MNNIDYPNFIGHIEKNSDGFVIGTSYNGEKTLLRYEGTADKVIIPDDITYIGSKSFINCKLIKEIIIPEGVKDIGESAFEICEMLETLNIPSSIERIEPRAFSHCKSLKKVKIKGNLEYIGNSAFKGCSALKELNIEGSINNISEGAFSGCESLEKVVIPSGIVSIGESAFAQCTALEEIEIKSNNFVYLGGGAFSNCSSLKKVVLPEGIEEIGENAFRNCISLTDLIFPKTLKSIGEKAFFGCTKIIEIKLPEGVRSISDESFSNCESLKKITIPKGVEFIGKNIFNCCFKLRNVRYKEINFFIDSPYELNLFYEEKELINQKDKLPIYIEQNHLASWILSYIFKKTPIEKVKANILDQYDEESFLKNMELFNKIINRVNYIENGIIYLANFYSPEEVIGDIFTKNPQLLHASIIENVINNYKYLVSQKILPEEELHSYYFGYSQEELIKRGIVTREETQNKDIEYITKILEIYFDENYNPEDTFTNEIPPLFSTLVVKPTPKNRLELRDRLLLASSIPYNNTKERIEILKGSSFETICRNDERDFVDERGVSSETFFKGYDKFKGIKNSLYRKLNGMNNNLVNDLNKLAIENPQNIFTNFLNSLETINNWNLFDSEIERANYFRNEFIGRILYAYLKILKQKKDTLENIDLTLPETLKMELFYNQHGISIVDIVKEATTSQEELFNDPELIEAMLKINSYSYDALRNYATKEQSEFCVYAYLAKQYGYLFKKEEKTEISKKIIEVIIPAIYKEVSERKKVGKSTEDLETKLEKIKSIFSKDKFMSTEDVPNFIEYVNNQLGLTKVPKNQKEKYLKEMKKIIAEYLTDSQEESIIDILKSIDLYCRINNEAELQTTQGYIFSSEALFDQTRIEDFSQEDRIMYCLFLMNKLAHNSKDINLLASIKDDYRFAGFHEHSLQLRKALDGYNRLEKCGLTMELINGILSTYELEKSNNTLRKYLNLTSKNNLDELLVCWSKFSESIYYALKMEQSIGINTEEPFPTDTEIKDLLRTIENQIPYLNEEQKEIIKALLCPTPIELTEEEKQEKKVLEQKLNLTEEEQKRLKGLQIKEKASNILNTSLLTYEEKIKLEELQTKEKNYRILEAMGIPNLEFYKLTPEEIEVLNNLNNKKNIEIINKIRNVTNNLLPISSLSEKESKDIETLAEEYHLFFKTKTILANTLINIFMKKEEQTLLYALSLDKKGKKEFYKKHGYIIEIQETDAGPTLVCLNKKLTKPFSVHLKDMQPELVNAIEQICISGIISTIAHVKIGSSTQYPTLKQERISKPKGKDLAQINILPGFNIPKGDKEWGDYLVSVYNYANYDYDEVSFIKEGIEQSNSEQRQYKLEELFSMIHERANHNPEQINVISKTFIDSLVQNGYDLTLSEFKNILKKQCLNSQELLFGTDDENNEKLEQLIGLYAKYRPNMLELIIEEKEGKQIQQICIRNTEEKVIIIDASNFSLETVERLLQRKERVQQEEQSKKNFEQPIMATNIEINLRNTVHTMAESPNNLECNRSQVTLNQVANPSKK